MQDQEPEALSPDHHSGYIAVIGRPNVGKSTLFNRLLGQKIAITSPKPQTTRDQLLGIYTQENLQIIFFDTPGIHRPEHKLGEHMVSVAAKTIPDVDVVLWLVDGSVKPTDEDRYIADLLHRLHQKRPLKQLVLGLNKADQQRAQDTATWRADEYLDLLTWWGEVRNRESRLRIQESKVRSQESGVKSQESEASDLQLPAANHQPPAANHQPPAANHQPPISNCFFSARNGQGVPELIEHLRGLLPLGPRYYAEDEVTDLQVRFLAEEIIREKALLLLQDEVPHSIAIEIDEFTERSATLTYISAIIYVERPTQKPIVLGEGGSMIKKIGASARREIETLLETKVYLELWVKVWEHWRTRPDLLRQLGYTE